MKQPQQLDQAMQVAQAMEKIAAYEGITHPMDIPDYTQSADLLLRPYRQLLRQLGPLKGEEALILLSRLYMVGDDILEDGESYPQACLDLADIIRDLPRLKDDFVLPSKIVD